MGGPTDNLFNTFETFDPPSTPALEVRVMPIDHVYVKSMVMSQDRMPYSNNTTGLVPYFHGPPVSVSEIGFTPGKLASGIAPSDTAASRKGYTGVYRFGASYNPGKFTMPGSTSPRSGNYLLYWIASQAVWRANPKEAKGLDVTASYDWSPRAVNNDYTMLTAGLRFNEPLPLEIHNTVSLGYVQNSLSSLFLSPGAPPWRTERGVEFNALLNVLPMIILQPVIQYYANVGGGGQSAVVIGFRTKVEF
jgi:carbohydrate-selective porin OprB